MNPIEQRFTIITRGGEEYEFESEDGWEEIVNSEAVIFVRGAVESGDAERHLFPVNSIDSIHSIQVA